MSFTPGFAPDAALQLRDMDANAQEYAIDELDRLALNPPKKDDIIVSTSWDKGSLRNTVFVHALIDHARRRVTAVGVGHVARTIPNS
jgi:hypothetical protein